jgi:hypothetical protein
MDPQGFFDAALRWLGDVGTTPVLLQAHSATADFVGRFGLLLMASVALGLVLVRKQRHGW